MSTLLFLNLGTPEIILILFFGAIPAILILVSLIDIVRSNFKDSTMKLTWVLVVLFLPILGALLYLLIGRSQKISSLNE